MNKYIPILIELWQRHCELTAANHDWLYAFAQVLAVKRKAQLYEPDADGRHKDYLYFVCTGLLATLWWDDRGNRRIDRFLLRNDSALTRHTLYTEKPANYHLVALRPSTVIRIPAEPFKAYREACREADVLSDILEYKKLKQFRAKDRLMLIKDERERYEALQVCEALEAIYLNTGQQEQADYLNISRTTITRVRQQR